MAFIVEKDQNITKEFLESPLRGGISMTYEMNPFKKWIWRQGGGVPNLLNTLLLFSQTRHSP